LCCLIPIQIAIARENKLIPLYNGLDAPEKYNIEYDKDDDNYTETISPITKEVIYVALDFEGIGSLERTPQEDLLLTLLNASLSNMILFKNQFVINRQITSAFQGFQNGANQLKNDSKIFKARLCIIIKDVPKHARKEIL
ncbi:23431_t:CDS:2, partial [Racocetra persica]